LPSDQRLDTSDLDDLAVQSAAGMQKLPIELSNGQVACAPSDMRDSNGHQEAHHRARREREHGSRWYSETHHTCRHHRLLVSNASAQSGGQICDMSRIHIKYRIPGEDWPALRRELVDDLIVDTENRLND
jgi:hypothetical protein